MSPHNLFLTHRTVSPSPCFESYGPQLKSMSVFSIPVAPSSPFIPVSLLVAAFPLPPLQKLTPVVLQLGTIFQQSGHPSRGSQMLVGLGKGCSSESLEGF